MSLINSMLCKFEINYAIFFSIISGNTILLFSYQLSLYIAYFSIAEGWLLLDIG